MANPLEKGQSANLPSEETTPQEEPLGIRNPLLSSTPLGQRFLSPKFLLPLGSRPLSTFDFSTFSSDSTLVQGFLDEAFWDSPFLNESPPILGSASLTLPQPILESVSAENAATFSTLVQPREEVLSLESPKNPPGNLTTEVPQQEILVQKTEAPTRQQSAETLPPESPKNPPDNLTTEVDQQEILVQRIEAPARQQSAETLASQSPENPANSTTEVPQQETLVQKNEAPTRQQSPETILSESPESPANSTTEVPQQEILVQKNEAPTRQQSPEIASESPESPANSTTEVPQQETLVQKNEAPTRQQSPEIASESPESPANSTTEVPQQEILVQKTEAATRQQSTEIASESPESPPSNLTTEVPQQEIVVQKTEAATTRKPSAEIVSESPESPANSTTEVPQQETLVQRIEAPARQQSAETILSESPESPANSTTEVPQQETLVQRIEAPTRQQSPEIASESPESPANSTTEVPQQETLVQRIEAPTRQQSPEIASESPENPVKNLTTEVPQQEVLVQRNEITQSQSRISQEAIDSPLIQRTEASSQVIKPSHKGITPSDEQIALTNHAPMTIASSELTETSTDETESLVQTKAAAGQAPNLIPKLDESASEKKQESELVASDSDNQGISSSSQIQSFPGNSLIQKQDSLNFRGQSKAAEVTKSVTEDSLLVKKVEASTPQLNAIAPATETPSLTEDSLLVQKVDTSIHDAGAIANPTQTPTQTPSVQLNAIALATETPSITEDSLLVNTREASESVSELTETAQTEQSLIQRKTDTQTPASTSKQTLEEVTPTTTEPSSRSESISEVTAPANQTVAQLLSENGETHQLPRVLENLATTKHLGVSQPLVQQSKFLRATSPIESSNNPTTNREKSLTTNLTRDSDHKSFAAAFTGKESKQSQVIHRQAESQPTAEIPSWSSIEELLGNHASESEPVVVQAFADTKHSATENQLSQNESNIPTSRILPSAIPSTKNLKNSNFSRQSADGQRPMQKSTKVSTKLKEAISIRKKEIEKPMPAQDIEPVGEDTSSQVIFNQNDNKSEENITDHIDALAREIYTLVRQRLEIERERHHGLYYSGRLPW